ncbi:unnamed protein product [Rangifer tarandus platyrhynchus]|uniref:Uncharacterized protein n=1 Tax=Rangifer tarandus platyrhynchus TaxID=3082113 RepID=A0ABN8XIA1_RANTA|nr:unnamed protein product [Rangifer tarandus platyrhynchus]
MIVLGSAAYVKRYATISSYGGLESALPFSNSSAHRIRHAKQQGPRTRLCFAHISISDDTAAVRKPSSFIVTRRLLRSSFSGAARAHQRREKTPRALTRLPAG